MLEVINDFLSSVLKRPKPVIYFIYYDAIKDKIFVSNFKFYGDSREIILLGNL